MAGVGGTMTLVAVSGVEVAYGATTILSDVTFTVERGDRWGIVGRNGTGKSSLLRLVAGEQAPSSGSVSRGTGLRVSVMDQHRSFPGATSVWEAAAGPFAELLALEHALAEQAGALAKAGDACTQAMLDRYARDLERFEREGGYTAEARVDAVLQGLGFDPDDARGRALTGLSGGERGRLALARQLAAPADLVLLDEPTNHLDLETTAWLEDHIAQLDATVMMISHDRALLQRLSDHVLHVESGTATPYGGDYDSFVRQRTERRLAQRRSHEKQARAIASEEDYIRRNIAGRNSAQAKGRRRRLDRVARLAPPPGEDGVMALRLQADERGGDQALVLEDVRVTIGERTLVSGFSARVRRGEVIGFVGPNGSGKSTLLRTVAGERGVESGEIRLPESVRLAYYRQDLGDVPAESTLYDIIAGLRPSWGRGPVQGHLGRFGFSGDSVLRRAGSLSGGERARVALAIIMLSGANLLLFDEPTNHLDVESIEALEDAIQEFEGTVILVSHDRALLRALTERVWVLHRQRITDFPGSFAEWEITAAERAHAAAVAAAEQEALRRVRDHHAVRRQDEPRRREQADQRTAARKLSSAEEEVASCEARVLELRRQLENPELYVRDGSAEEARRLGGRLEEARVELEGALGRWESAAREAGAQ